MVVGGSFTRTPGGAAIAGVARWNGSVWSGFGAGLGGPVTRLLPSSVGGQGLFAARSNAPLSRWDGTTWQSPGSGAPSSVSAMTEYASPTGPVVVAATNALLGPPSVPAQVTTWNGVTWSVVGVAAPYFVEEIKALASDPFMPGLLYIGGKFGSFGGLAQPNLVCWNGTSVVPPPFAWGNLDVRLMKVLDDGGGPALFIVGRGFSYYPYWPPVGASLYRWNGTSLVLIGDFGPSGFALDVTDLAVVTESSGPVLYATGGFETIFGASVVGNVGRRVAAGWWTGLPGATVGTSPSTVQGFQEGGGFAAYLGGGFTSFGVLPSAHLARFGCPRPSISLTQIGGTGSPMVVTSSGLVLGRETFNVFSLEPCFGTAGGGPYLGLCATYPATLLDQATLPLGTPPFHVTASQSSMTFGPYLVPPVVVDALCIDFDPSLGYRWSPTFRLAIQ